MTAQEIIDKLEAHIERIRDLDPALRASLIRWLDELRGKVA